MTRNLRKELYILSRFRNKFYKNSTKKKLKMYIDQRNECVASRRNL